MQAEGACRLFFVLKVMPQSNNDEVVLIDLKSATTHPLFVQQGMW